MLVCVDNVKKRVYVIGIGSYGRAKDSHIDKVIINNCKIQ